MAEPQIQCLNAPHEAPKNLFLLMINESAGAIILVPMTVVVALGSCFAVRRRESSRMVSS